MIETGLYIVKEKIFTDMNESFLKFNKEENRPHYYCFQDKKTGLFWLIPLSKKIDKYRKIIQSKEAKGKPCDILHILKLDNGKESVFLIQDMFPITENYIEREYTINGNHLRVTSEHAAKTINRKAKKVLSLLKRGIKFTPTQPDVMKIEKNLLAKNL